jgi:hypothetical protein
MYHRLLVSRLVVTKVRSALVERLANTGNVAVAENAEHPREKCMLIAVAFDILVAEESYHCLGCRETPVRSHDACPSDCG